MRSDGKTSSAELEHAQIDRVIRALWWGAGIYLVFSLFLLAGTMLRSCAIEAASTAPWDRLIRAMACMSPNEVGDMLAGLFAPLAFIGLVISIAYQRRDLAIQREEMVLTREEMAEQRKEMRASAKALRAQAEEARRTAEFMGKQAAIAQAQIDKVQADRAIESFRYFYNSASSVGSGTILRNASRTVNPSSVSAARDLGGIIRRVARMPETQPNILDDQLQEGDFELLDELRRIKYYVSEGELAIQCHINPSHLNDAIAALERGCHEYRRRNGLLGEPPEDD